jgi:hypothetical protein
VAICNASTELFFLPFSGYPRKYPWRGKRSYPGKWPTQAVSGEHGRVVLPLGKGRKSIKAPVASVRYVGRSIRSGEEIGMPTCKQRRRPKRCQGDVLRISGQLSPLSFSFKKSIVRFILSHLFFLPCHFVDGLVTQALTWRGEIS